VSSLAASLPLTGLLTGAPREDGRTLGHVSGEGGTVPPLIQAARGQCIMEAEEGSRFILYTRFPSGRIDQVIDTKVGPDRRTILAGVVAEFGLANGTGRAFKAGPGRTFGVARPNSTD